MPAVSALYVYPIKSCRGLELKAVRLDRLGPLYDRRFMVVDGSGRFLTQRELPRMALITPRLGPTSLNVSAPEMPALKVPMTQRDARRIEVTVWGHLGPAEDAGESAADWFSSFLQTPCRLVRFAEGAARPVSRKHARFKAETSFTDGYPVLLLSEASLEDLNGRLTQRLPVDRFRPNVVVSGCDAFAEDGWRQIRAGELLLDVVKPCARCSITTVDQVTGRPAKEPLVTLASYRTRENEVFFGQNCVHHGPGSIRVGDEVEVLERS